MTDTPISDLCDAHDDLVVCEPLFQSFGGRAAFSGPISTLKVFEDNALVREALEGQGEGRVLVVDGGVIGVRGVDVLHASREQVFVGAGLESGEHVVVSPLANAVDGMRVAVTGRD